MHRLLLSCAALWALTLTTASAAPGSDSEGTIKTYQRTNASIQAVTEAAIKRFNAKYPKVKVETQWLPLGSWGEYISGFLNQVASGDVPDIYEVAIEGFSSVASRGILIPLDDMIARDASAKSLLDDIDPNLLAGMSRATGGKLYFFPTSWNDVVMFYNKDLFDESGLPYPRADWTWEEFAATAKALTKTDKSGKATQYGYFVPGINFALSAWLVSNDTEKLKSNWRESNARDPKFMEALRFLHDLIHTDKSAPAFDNGVGAEQFAAKQVAMISAGHWVVPSFLQSGLKNVGVTTMPHKAASATVFGVGGLGISKASKAPELAWELIKEMTGPEAQAMYAATNRNVPALRSAAMSAEFLKYPEHASIFYGEAAKALPIAAPANFTEVEDIFMRNVTAYMTDNITLDAIIEKLDSELARAMRRLR